MRTKKLWLVTIAALWCSLTVSAQTDVTAEYIANPSFEGGSYDCDNGTGNGNLFSPEGWTVTYTNADWGWKNFQPVSDGKGQDGNQYFEFWGNIYHSLDLSQEVRLPAGTYVLTAAMRTERADQVTNQHIYAKVGDNIYKSATLGTPIGSAWNAVDAWQTLTVEFTLFQTSDVTIGASSSGEAGSKGWFQIDNFRLTKTTIKKDWYFDEATGYLYVNKDYDYSSSSSYPWYAVSAVIKSVEFGPDVTSIGNYAFRDCSSLTTITIPENSQLTSIEDYAFRDCSSLTSITLPESVTSIGEHAFSDCRSLTSITIPENSQLTSIGNNAFMYCDNLTSITIPSSVTSIGEDAFFGCDNLKTVINYSDLNIEKNSSDYGYVGYYADRVINMRGTVGAVASGEYYLYHADSHRFLSRGENWGTRATVDKYGIPFVWTAEEYSLKFLDSNVCLFETDDSNIYTDNNSTGFAFEEVEGGYLLKSLKSDRYLTIVDKAYTNQIVNVTDNASAAVVWQLKSKAEHDAIVAGYVEENYTNVIAASGISTTARDFANYLSTLPAEEKTSAIGTARFAGSVGDWTYAEVRHQDWQPAYGTDFCELWQATGSYTQTITGLAKGIYKVTMQGYERLGWWDLCVALGDKGYEITTATLSANGEEVNLKSWYSGKSGDNNPDNTSEAVAKFGEGKYMNEVYTYVGADRTLTLTVNKPSFVGYDWILFNNFTLTRYIPFAVEEITLSKETATLIEGETLTLVAVVSPDNATDKTVIWSTSDDKVATVDENGKITAVAPGTVTITATANEKDGVSASCEVTVDAMRYTVTFIIDNVVIATDSLEYGATIVAPEVLEREGHTFSGWSTLPETMPAEDVTITGSFAINSYTLTYTVDGDTVQTESVVYNTEIVALEEPTKEGYTFSGWSEIPDSMPASNVTVIGNFAINSYTLTYTVDGDTLQTDSVVYNTEIVALEEPTKVGYTFSGWSEIPANMPASDVTIIGSFAINSYTLTYTVDGDTVQTDSVVYNTEIVALEEPTREGYTFSGWSEIPATMPASDVTIIGSFTINSYTLTYTVDGDTVQTDSVVYNSEIVALEEPTKVGYTFSGWSEIPDSMPASNVTVIGSFAINSYTLTYTVDGDTVQTDSVVYNTEIVALEEPTKVGYTFSGWSEIPDSMPAKDVTIIGSFTINSYTLTYTVDGDTVQTDSVVYNTEIVALEEPTKVGHTFSGWSEIPANMPASDVTIIGSFAINSYTLTYTVDGDTVQTDSVVYNTEIVALEEPTKEGCTFSGWSEIPDSMPAKDVTISGSFTINSYTLTYTVDGDTVQTDSVVYNTEIVALEEPTREGYTFSGWSEIPDSMPANDVTITGIFTINKYLVTFKIGDMVIAADSLEYKAAIIAPEAPEKEGYTFNGWGEVAETMPAHDVTYEGTYTVNVYKVYYYVGEDLVHTAEVAYGESIPEYVYEPTIEGDIFEGWVGENHEIMPAHDVVYTANITNSIDRLNLNSQHSTIYDLTGHKVLVDDMSKLSKGIYIINGRKVLVR